jgi:predicted RNA-binding protein with PIN domain
VTFLIDGYNLMFAVGLAGRDTPAPRFERARERFLDWLADGAAGRAEVRVVFDALNAPSPSLATLHRGVRVRFAFGQTADDLIEELLAEELRPELLTVVSNDLRVRESARRAGCVPFACEKFIDWVLTPADAESDARPPDEAKPNPTPDEVEELLRAFARPKPKP